MDPDDSTIRETLPGNTYEPALTALIKKIFQDEDTGVFIDVGALYGFFPIYTHKINSNVKNYAYEPSKRSFEVLKKNLEINELTNSEIYDVALSSFNGTQKFKGKTLIKDSSSDKNNDEKSSGYVDSFDFSNKSTSVKSTNIFLWSALTIKHTVRELLGWNKLEIVECITFDKHFKKPVNDGPKVLKIDVHGAEIAVMKGMRESLSEGYFDVIFLELHRDDMLVEGTHKDIVNIIKTNNLKVYEIHNFRKNDEWELVHLSSEDIELLESSKNWSVTEKITMKMLMLTKEDGNYDKI